LGTWKGFLLPGTVAGGRRRALETECLSLPEVCGGEQVGWASLHVTLKDIKKKTLETGSFGSWKVVEIVDMVQKVKNVK
jgi:hypothetical protein